MGRSKYVVNPDTPDSGQERASSPLSFLSSTVLILTSFVLYLLDQGTDALTALLYFLDGHTLEGCLTAGLILAPGLACCVLELRDMWRGRGHCAFALLQLGLCPLTSCLAHLASIWQPRWRARALLTKTMEGFLCAGPQLVLQLALWMRGTLTGPLQLVMDDLEVVTMAPETPDTVANMTIFGRHFSHDERYMFGVVQVVSIFISFVSLFFSVLHFNELEAKSMTVKSAGKVLLGILFFLLTIVFRAVGLALILCFLGWWAAIIIFLMFFSTVLTALCIGDNILRATVYGIWSFLVPVGYARDPMEPLDYNVLSTKDLDRESDESESELPWFADEDKETVARSRSGLFLTSHTLTSLVVLYPSLALVTILVTRARGLESDIITTMAIFPVSYLSYVFLPALGLILAVSILIVRPFHRADRAEGEVIKGTIIV